MYDADITVSADLHCFKPLDTFKMHFAVLHRQFPVCREEKLTCAQRLLLMRQRDTNPKLKRKQRNIQDSVDGEQ